VPILWICRGIIGELGLGTTDPGILGTEMPVSGDFTSTFTGGDCASVAPQLEQNLASSEFALPHREHEVIS
jgi:hypothetical protein